MAEERERPDAETLDRNWSELLQEIRVTQTGVQILTGFLLTVPFSQRFTELDDSQRTTYLLVLCGSVLTTILVVAPAAFHRVLFRHRARYWLVQAANQCARAGLVMMALTISGVLHLVFDIVIGETAAALALVVSLMLFTVIWGGTPMLSDHREHRDPPPR